MNGEYTVHTLTTTEAEALQRCYAELLQLGASEVPAVRAAARAAVAHIAQALNGQGLAYDFYTSRWEV